MVNKNRRISKEQLAVIEHRKKTLEEADVKGFVKRIQKFEEAIAAEKYGKRYYELSEEERREVTYEAHDREIKEMLLWGRPEADREQLEKLSADELIEVFKVK